MSDVRRRAELTRAECQRLAAEAEQQSLGVGLTAEERLELSEKARVYRQMAEIHGDTIINSADVRPEKFTARNKGHQSQTKEKVALVLAVQEQNGLTRKQRQKLTYAVWDHPDAKKLFDSEASVYRFLGRKNLF